MKPSFLILYLGEEKISEDLKSKDQENQALRKKLIYKDEEILDLRCKGEENQVLKEKLRFKDKENQALREELRFKEEEIKELRETVYSLQYHSLPNYVDEEWSDR